MANFNFEKKKIKIQIFFFNGRCWNNSLLFYMIQYSNNNPNWFVFYNKFSDEINLVLININNDYFFSTLLYLTHTWKQFIIFVLSLISIWLCLDNTVNPGLLQFYYISAFNKQQQKKFAEKSQKPIPIFFNWINNQIMADQCQATSNLISSLFAVWLRYATKQSKKIFIRKCTFSSMCFKWKSCCFHHEYHSSSGLSVTACVCVCMNQKYCFILLNRIFNIFEMYFLN